MFIVVPSGSESRQFGFISSDLPQICPRGVAIRPFGQIAAIEGNPRSQHSNSLHAHKMERTPPYGIDLNQRYVTPVRSARERNFRDIGFVFDLARVAEA